MKGEYSYQFNLVIAIISITLGLSYILITASLFFEQLKCASCKEATMLTFKHYWYRWGLYSVLIFAGYRLFNRLVGARRLYYVFFAGITIIALHDILKHYYSMDGFDLTINVVIPIAFSFIGTIYFMSYYRHTLKYR